MKGSLRDHFGLAWRAIAAAFVAAAFAMTDWLRDHFGFVLAAIAAALIALAFVLRFALHWAWLWALTPIWLPVVAILAIAIAAIVVILRKASRGEFEQ